MKLIFLKKPPETWSLLHCSYIQTTWLLSSVRHIWLACAWVQRHGCNQIFYSITASDHQRFPGDDFEVTHGCAVRCLIDEYKRSFRYLWNLAVPLHYLNAIFFHSNGLNSLSKAFLGMTWHPKGICLNAEARYRVLKRSTFLKMDRRFH